MMNKQNDSEMETKDRYKHYQYTYGPTDPYIRA